MLYRLILFVFLSVFASVAQGADMTASLFNLGKEQDKKEDLSKEAQKEIKDLIQTLENKGKRDNLVKALKALTISSKAKENQETFFQHLAKTTAEKLKSVADMTTNAIAAVIQLPVDLALGLSNLSTPEVRTHFLSLISCLLLLFIGGLLFEFATRYFFNAWPYTNDLQSKGLVKRLLFGYFPVLVFSLLVAVGALFVVTSNNISVGILSLLFHVFLVRTIWFVSLIIVSPKHEDMRIVPMSNQDSMRLHTWLLILGNVWVALNLIYQLIVPLRLEPDVMKNITNVSFFIMCTLGIGFLNSFRDFYYQRLRLDDVPDIETSGRLYIILMSALPRLSYLFLLSMVVGLFLAKALEAEKTFEYLYQSFGWSLGVFGVTFFLSKKIQAMASHWVKQYNEIPVQSPKKRQFWTETTHSMMTLLPVLQLAIWGSALIIILRIWGIDLLELINDEATRDIVMAIVAIIIILWATRLLWSAWNMILDHQMKSISVKGRVIEPSVIVKTLGPIIRTLGHVVLFIACGVLMLQQMGINALPLFYGFGILGLAFGFGAQDLARDLINGVLVLIEGNLAVGESVIIGSYAGTVERITPRSVFLRHPNGHLQNIPFSEVKNIINRSRDFSVAKLFVTIEIETPLEKVIQALEETLAQVKQHSYMAKWAKGPLKILGVQEKMDDGYTVVATVRTLPDPGSDFPLEFYRQWRITSQEMGIRQPVQRQQIELVKNA